MIAVRYDDTDDVTGHTMLAASAPREVAVPGKPQIGGTTQWLVDVYDSTSTPHADADTRRYADGGGTLQSQQGAGRGTLRVYADASGRIVGHTWSPKATT